MVIEVLTLGIWKREGQPLMKLFVWCRQYSEIYLFSKCIGVRTADSLAGQAGFGCHILCFFFLSPYWSMGVFMRTVGLGTAKGTNNWGLLVTVYQGLCTGRVSGCNRAFAQYILALWSLKVKRKQALHVNHFLPLAENIIFLFGHVGLVGRGDLHNTFSFTLDWWVQFQRTLKVSPSNTRILHRKL